MQVKKDRMDAVRNVLGVLKWSNAQGLLSEVLRLEKDVVLGVAAEASFVVVLMLAALVISLVLVLVGGGS